MRRFKLYSITVVPGKIVPVTVTITISEGFGIRITGLPDSAVKETLLRVVTAIQSAGSTVPGKRIAIEVSPALPHKLPYSQLDLPIALGLLAIKEELYTKTDINNRLIAGELRLNADVVEPQLCDCIDISQMAKLARSLGLKGLVVPSVLKKEQQMPADLQITRIRHLRYR